MRWDWGDVNNDVVVCDYVMCHAKRDATFQVDSIILEAETTYFYYPHVDKIECHMC